MRLTRSDVTLLAAALLGCGETTSSDTTPSDTFDAGSSPISANTTACTPRACTCDGGSGQQMCIGDTLGPCECRVQNLPPPPAVNVRGDCIAGPYTGNFEGLAGFVITQAPVSGSDILGGTLPLQINLQRPDRADEFAIVGNGIMRGNANGSFPFKAQLTGELDCPKKRFSAQLVGSVTLFLDGVENAFVGKMEANYDGEKHAFVDGVWNVMGSNADGGLDFALVGNGTWHAELADASVDGADGGATSALDAGVNDGG
jgi:hypothetical protein